MVVTCTCTCTCICVSILRTVYINFLCVYVCVCVVVDSQTGQQVKVHRQAVYESLKEYLKGTQCTCNSTELKCAMTDCCSG